MRVEFGKFAVASVLSVKNADVLDAASSRETRAATHEGRNLGDKEDVAALLKSCTRTVENLMAQGLPHMKVTPRMVRFDMDDVRAWMKQQFGTQRR